MSSATETPIKNRDAINIFKALSALDGQPEAVKAAGAEGDATHIIIQPYKFGGTARLVLARWLARLKQLADELSKVHDGLVRQYAEPANPVQVSDANQADFDAEWEKVLSAVTTVGLAKVRVEDLDAEGNRIPVSVLATLDPILV